MKEHRRPTYGVGLKVTLRKGELESDLPCKAPTSSTAIRSHSSGVDAQQDAFPLDNLCIQPSPQNTVPPSPHSSDQSAAIMNSYVLGSLKVKSKGTKVDGAIMTNGARATACLICRKTLRRQNDRNRRSNHHKREPDPTGQPPTVLSIVWEGLEETMGEPMNHIMRGADRCRCEVSGRVTPELAEPLAPEPGLNGHRRATILASMVAGIQPTDMVKDNHVRAEAGQILHGLTEPCRYFLATHSLMRLSSWHHH